MTFIDSRISNDLLFSSLELILKLESKINPGVQLFVAIVKNWRGLYDLMHKKIVHNKASNVASYLLAYLLDTYGEKVLSIFNPFYQDQVRLVVWENNIALFDYKKDLEEENKIEFDFIDLINSETKSPKGIRIYEEVTVMIRMMKTADYVKDSEIIEASSAESA